MNMLSRLSVVGSGVSRSTWRRGYQSGAAGVYGHNPGALERLRSVRFPAACFPTKRIRLCTNEIHICRGESEAGVVVDHDARNASPNLHRLVSAFRSSGHKYARTNPVPMAHQTP